MESRKSSKARKVLDVSYPENERLKTTKEQVTLFISYFTSCGSSVSSL